MLDLCSLDSLTLIRGDSEGQENSRILGVHKDWKELTEDPTECVAPWQRL
jgi:hypothetical protein